MIFFNNISFAQPLLLWLLIVIPLLTASYILRNNWGEIKISSLSNLANTGRSFKEYIKHILFGFKMIAIGLLIVAVARPQSKTSWKNITTEGIDIILAIDISASMLAKDFKPNRMEAAKEVAKEFVEARPNDRIGIVIFSGESFTQCPLTTDHAIIKNLMGDIKTGMVADGTAIGMGLATAVSRIKDSKAKSKVIILLTDGVNNMGAVAPQTAADIAKAFGIRVYTVGVGTMGKALAPVAMYPNGQYVFEYVPVDLDEKMLTGVAETTGGKYFRATGNDKLLSIYKEIDKMEKTIIEERKHTRRTEEFFPFALLAGILLLLDFSLNNTILRSLP
ncbi:MAG: VWA domain-containing protein [Bacteroidetes bacterium]|nr:MAG: VWA domain-containing protein [Bacteroidota bacterium]